MISRTVEPFWALFAALPDDVRARAVDAFRRFATDPWHPGLQFKRIAGSREIWSARITDDYRSGDSMTWYWIGSHAEYDQLTRRLRR